MKETLIIDGKKVEGEWRKVHNGDDVTIGQRVRYGGCKIGYNGEQRVIGWCKGIKWVLSSGGSTCSDCDFDFWVGGGEAFFPTKKEKRKVAKVVIRDEDRGFWWDVQLKYCIVSGNVVKSRKSAIRGAKRFCNLIGHEFELAKKEE